MADYSDVTLHSGDTGSSSNRAAEQTWQTGQAITADKMNSISYAAYIGDNFSRINKEKIASIMNYFGYTASQMGSGNTIKDKIKILSDDVSDLKASNNLSTQYGTRIGAIEQEIAEAVTRVSNIGVTNPKLYDAIGKIVAMLSTTDGKASQALSKATATEDEVINARGNGNNTLSARFVAIESVNTTQNTRLGNLEDEVQGARNSNAKGAAGGFGSLDARLEDIDEEIVAARGNLANINARLTNIETTATTDYNSLLGTINTGLSQKVNTSQIYNGLDKDEAGFVLDARAGLELKGDIDAIDTAYKAVDETLDGRLDTIEADLNTASTGLKARMDAIDNASTGAIKSLQDADTALDARLDAIDGGSALTGTALATRVTTIEDNIGTGFSSTDTVSKAVSDINTALSGKASSSDLSTLAGRVTSLENNPISSTVLVSYNRITYNNSTGLPTIYTDSTKATLDSTITQDIDYLLADDEGTYSYWKYIGEYPNGTWNLISGGAGGGGTSSAEFYTTLPLTGEDNVDYFIGSGTSYIHYRWQNNQWVTILPSGLLNHASVDISEITVGEGAEAVTTHKSRPIVKAYGSEANLLENFNAIQSISADPIEGGGYKITWVNIDGETSDVTITGGGGGSSTAATAVITRVTDSNLTTISGENCSISYKFVAKDSNNDLVATAGTATWYINRAQVATSQANVNNPENENDYNSFNITQYLQNGVNNITLSVRIEIDNETITRTKTWVVDVKNFSLSWEYDESTVQDSSTINFTCTPYGTDITKVLHLKIDNVEITTQTVTTSSIPTTISINNTFTHGSHKAELYMTATINGESKQTDIISHDFIVIKPGNTNPIIAATLPSNTMDQYNTITIPFVVYNPTSTTSTVILSVDDVTIDTRTNVPRTSQKWNYTPLTSGAKELKITVGSITKTLNLTVNSININNNEIGNYAFKLKASELPSNSALQNWHYDDSDVANTKLEFSNNFDWINGGIQTEYDENDQLRQFIRIKSGTTMTIPYKMFATDPRSNGSNFKIIFKIENCRDYDTTILNCVAENIGIQLNAHNAIFKSTTSQISTQYSEEEYTELEFEIYKATDNNNNTAPDQYMMAWVDGVITSARKYGGNFVQTSGNASSIVIGSDYCDVCVYLVKYYAKALSRDDHVINFIADAPNAVEMISRYNRNNILDDDGDISPSLLAQQNRDCRVWLYDIDRMTTGKKDAVNVNTFQQIWQNGDQYYQLSGTNAKLTVQGTSSVNYRKGAANTDINFGVEGATLVDGYGNNLLSDELPTKGFKLNNNSTPITYSNTKVNFASCEQVNNMCNAEWYQRYQPYPSNSIRDCMEFTMGVQFIKDRGIDEPTDPDTNIQEVKLFTEKPNRSDEKFYMYSIANMGTSKKNTHIFHGENECCIEVKENTSDAQKMKSFDSAWTDSNDNTQNYEMRYPDVKNTKVPTAMKNGWARFVQWMVANNPNAATNAALPEPVTFAPYTFHGHNRTVTNTTGRNFEQVLRGSTVSQYAGTYTNDTFEYRMAKMLSECEDYMAMDSVVYHFCFIERHTMVDNVAKNTFWSSDLTNQYINGVEQEDTEGYWIWDLSKNYDNDTSDGNNNNGLLIFDYGNEANDTYNQGVPVFNGHDAVWFVFVSNLYEACQTMFVNRETKGAWNSTTYHQYLSTEQHKIPERVWNECYWYDYLRTYEQGIETTWINFLDGGQKIHQRAHYETYQEIYEASKYRSTFSHGQSITLRGEAIDYETLGLPAQESKFTITMFNKCYLTIWIGTNYQTVKCQKGVPVTLEFFELEDPINYSSWIAATNYNVKDKVNYNGIQYECISAHTSQSEQTPNIDITHWKPVYMSLSNSVIDIDSGSMVQAIGDLSRIYPSSGQFGSAKRLRSLQIGSSTTGYYNPNMNTNSVLTFNNKMLEELYVQNLPQATYNLDLNNCPELRYLDASGSGFTGFVFANGGLLNEAYINAPTSLIMRNLDYLTNANFHLANTNPVTLLRLEGCKLFNNYNLINSLPNLNTLRVTNVNWSLSNLTLLDRLLGLMGIDDNGYTINQSYLAGTVTLTGTVYEGKYNSYMSAWSPDLTIDYSNANWVQQHLVTYKDENNNILYKQYISNGDYLIDPYNNNLIDLPTKNADIQSQYIFGELDNFDQYIPFSGWRMSSDSLSLYKIHGENPAIQVTGIMNLVTVFTTTPQRYIVRWILQQGANPIKTTDTPQNYGGGYNLIAPTIKEIQATGQSTYSFSSNGDYCTYNIMTGWEKLPTNIAPTELNSTYDIYATWLSRTNVDYHTVLSSNDYSVEEKLFILKQMASARSSINLGDKYAVKLGYNGLKPAIDLVATPTRYSGTATQTNYAPFSDGKSFTIAIDYKFEHKTSNTANEAILLSCYEDNNGSVQGFKLFYNPRTDNSNPVPQISFGSTAQQSSTNIQTIGSSINNRGMVVLRHIAGDPYLYIYSGTDAGGLITTYGATFRKTVQWSGNISNAKIYLGGIYNPNNLQTIMNANGTLYSVKYWEEDLGEGECLQLASWCHETITLAVSDYRENINAHSAINSSLNSSIVLHTLNASEMGTITEPQIDFNNTSSIGWDPSVVRTLYNNRIYQALPILLQSIISPATVAHYKGLFDSDIGGYSISRNESNTQDYVFAPSCIEVGVGKAELNGQNITSGNHSAEAQGSFPWCSSANQMLVKKYNNGALDNDDDGNINYTNLRFPYRANEVNRTITVYTNYPSTNSSFYNWAVNNASITFHSGDIFIPSGENQVAYMYVTSQETLAGAPIVSNAIISEKPCLSGASGGWIQSVGWWTRSVPDTLTGKQAAKFVYINQLGAIITNNTKTQGIVYSLAL